MRILRSYPILCFVFVLLGILGVCISLGSVALLVVAGALAAVSWYITEGPRGWSIPKWVANVLIIPLTLYVLVELVQGHGDILQVLGHFALWLTIIKLYERHEPRDYAQLMSLSLLLMLIGAMRSGDLLFGIVLALHAALGLYALLLYQLYAAHERINAERRKAMPNEVDFPASIKPISGSQVGLQFRTLAGGIGMVGLALSVMVFIVFPRGIGESAIGAMAGQNGRARTTFTDEINLVRGSRINESRRAVLNLQILDADDRPMRLATPILLRGAVLDRYEGSGRWTRRDRGPHRVFVQADEFRELDEFDIDEDSLLTLKVEHFDDSRVLFTAFTPVAITTSRPRMINYEAWGRTITSDRDAPPLSRYRTLVDRDPADARLERMAQFSRSSPTRRGFSVGHPGLRDQEVADLARQILRDAGLPESAPETEGEDAVWQWQDAAASAFTRFLQSPRFIYTIDLSDIVLTARDGRVIDPIIGFLLDHRRGHCEYFASALVALCENVGIESRIVTGYVAYAYDEALQRYKVLELNAHAWAEIRTGLYRWREFDPTPPRIFRELHLPETTMADQLRWFYDRFDDAWSRTVVHFDASSQREIADRWDLRFAERLVAIRSWVVDRLREINQIFFLGPAGYIWLGIVALVLGLAATIMIRLLRRAIVLRRVLRVRRIHDSRAQQMLRQLGFYAKMLDVLERGRQPKPEWLPPQMFAERLMSDAPDLAALIHRIALLYYQARYGPEPLSHEELREARSQLRELASRLGVQL